MNRALALSLEAFRRPRVRGLLLGVCLLGLAWACVVFFNGVRPVRGWLALQLAKLWGYELLLSLSCASFGHWVLVRWLGLDELDGALKLAISLVVGLVGFVVGIYLGGFVGVLGPVFAIALPLVLLAAGTRCGSAALRRAWSERAERRAISGLELLVVAYGVLCVGILYLGVLSPDSINYDASWMHLVIAQDYGRAGRIVPFPGDWVKNVPHLGSVVNTWAFIVPGLHKPALRWMLAQHNEMAVLLWTLVGVLAGARHFAERARLRGAWAAMFLFPGLFVYDGNLGCAADHFLALFAVPTCIAAFWFMARPRWREGVLLGILAGGGLLTKLQAVYLLIPLSVAIAVSFARLGWLQYRGRAVEVPLSRALAGAAAAATTAIVLLSLHFGSNAVFYGNPFYPFAQGSFPSTPTVPDAQFQVEYLFADWHWRPPPRLGPRLRAAVDMLWSFSFKPHYSFVGDVPVFGSLLTLLVPAIAFLGRKPRVWLAMAVCHGALFVWAYTYWVDRNLQTLLPLMAACVAAIAVLVWELGIVARVGLCALIGLQVVWGADYYFSGSDRIANAIALIRSGMDGHAATRFDGYRRDYVALGNSLPERAVVALHGEHVMLGINRPVYLDWVGFQGAIDYRTFRSPRDLQKRLLELGITHLVWLAGERAEDSKQEAVIFASFVARSMRPKGFGGLRVAPVPSKPVADDQPMQVFSWQVPSYENGTYPVEWLGTNEGLPPQFQQFAKPLVAVSSPESIVAELRRVNAVIVGNESTLPPDAQKLLRSRFTRVTQSSGPNIYHVR